MAAPDRETQTDAGAETEGEVAPSAAPAPHWSSLLRRSPGQASDSPEQQAMLARLQHTAGNARVARLLREVAPPPAAAGKDRAPGGTLLVADETGDAGAGRMSVGTFLDAVEQAVTEVAAKEVGAMFQVVGCPWLAHWIGYYRRRQPGEVEAALKRYAPDAAGAKTAEEYVDLVVRRVREGIATWQKTGVAPEPPADSPGAPPGAEAAAGSPPPAFKMRDRGSVPGVGTGGLGGRLGAGERLDSATAGAVGSAFGADLSDVRVHRDGGASQLVGGMGARAVAIGRDVAFAPGQYEPGTPVGDTLIAHELAHVVQQTAPGGATADTATLEKDADSAAMGAVAARWSGGSARPPARAANPLRAQSCPVPAGSKGEVFDEEADALAKKSRVHLHIEPDPQGKPMPIGFTPHFRLDAPPTMGSSGAGQTHYVRQWYVAKPGAEPRRRNSPTPGGGRFHVEMDEEGQWMVFAKLRIDDIDAYLVRRFQIVKRDEIADVAFKEVGPSDYVHYRTLMNQERLKRAGGVDLDQSKVSGAYITNEGPDAKNPAPIAHGLGSYKYQVHPNPKAPPDKKPVKYRWWAIPREADDVAWARRSDVGIRRTEYKGELAYYLGEGEAASLKRAGAAKVEIVCECIDANDKLVDTAHYQQMIMRSEGLAAVEQVEKMMKEGTAAYKKIKAGAAQGVKAMHLDARRGKTSSLTMFIGPSADDPSKTMLVDLTPGAEYEEHEGSSVAAAIKHLDDNNSYGVGQLLIRVEGPPAVEKRLKTTGETDLQDAAQKTGIGSMVLTGLGILAAATGVGAPLAPFLIAGGLGMGAVSGGLSIADELRKAKPSGTKVAIDVAGIVGALAGAGGMAQAARMGSVELAMATAAGRFFIYTGFAFDLTGGILIAADTSEKIEQIRKSRMSEEEKIDAIHKLILQLVVVGGLIAFGARDVGAARKRLIDLVGEERVGMVKRPQTLYTLQGLDDSVLKALQKVPVTEFEDVAVALAKDPRKSAQLSKAFGEKFIEEVRANPGRSLDETADVLGAKAAGAPTGPVGGTRGPDVYQLDPAKGLRGKSETAKKRFERGVNSSREGRMHGATIDKGTLKVDADSATLEMRVKGETVKVTIELKKTDELAGGAHSKTGGAGPARIVQLEPPKNPGDPWTAKVQLDDALGLENVPFVLGHELDEVADFVVAKGAKGIGSLAGEMEAGIFVTWAKRGSKTPPAVTTHDRANAREFLNVAADLRSIEIELVKKPTDAALIARRDNRRETLRKLTHNMGLLDPEHLELKLATLRKSLSEMDSGPKGVLTSPGPKGEPAPFDTIVDGIHRGVTITEFQSAVASASGRTVFTQELVAHLMRPKPQTRGDFLTSGLHGGHHDATLHGFLAANPEYALVKKNEAQSGFVTYRNYDQYRWNEATGKPAPPRGTPGRPETPGPNGIDPGWELAKTKNANLPKTTFDDPTAFFADADAIIKDWQKKLTPTELANPMTGPKVIGTGDPRLFLQFSYTPADAAKGTPAVWEIRSVAIDETWIAAAEKAASTPTPAPTGATK